MKRIAIWGLVVGVVLTVVMARDVIANLQRPLIDHDDLTWQYFLFDNNLKKITQGEWGSWWDTRMFYPEKRTLAWGNSLLGQSLLALPIYLVTHDVVTAANSVVVLQLWLAFVAMYLLAYYVARSTSSGLIAGMIYAFNPYVMAHLHHEQLALGYLPALFLVTEVMIRRGITWRRSLLWAGVWLWLLVSAFYYTFFAAVTLPIYIWLRWSARKKPIRWRPLIVCCGVMVAIGVIYLRPFLAVQQKYEVKWPVVLVKLLSAKPQDFLFTTKGNWLYGRWATSPWRDEFARDHPTEHSLFPGIIVLMLAGIAGWKKQGKAWWVLLGVSLALSMGLMAEAYTALAIRAVSRFWIVGMMALGILAGIGYAYASSKLKVKNSKLRQLILLGVLILIGIEYWQVGWVRPFTIAPEMRQFYSWLNQDKETRVIVELPIANNLTNAPSFERSAYDDGQYLLYALYHDKQLVNGHHSFIPPAMAERGRWLTIDFPTKQKLEELRQLGVDMIVVHREEYRNVKVAEKVLKGLRELGLVDTYASGTIIALRI